MLNPERSGAILLHMDCCYIACLMQEAGLIKGRDFGSASVSGYKGAW